MRSSLATSNSFFIYNATRGGHQLLMDYYGAPRKKVLNVRQLACATKALELRVGSFLMSTCLCLIEYLWKCWSIKKTTSNGALNTDRSSPRLRLIPAWNEIFMDIDIVSCINFLSMTLTSSWGSVRNDPKGTKHKKSFKWTFSGIQTIFESKVAAMLSGGGSRGGGRT